jgi:hypothetical protein
VISLRGEAIALRSSVSAPPGARLEGALVAPPPGALWVKVHGCRRQPEGDFVVDGRLFDTTRDVRARLEALGAPA